MIIVETICIISAIFVITVFSSGRLERCKKRSENETFVKALWNTIKTGFLKVLSSVGIALVTTAISVLILSTFIKPEPQNIMPAFYYDGTYEQYNNEEVTDSEIFNRIFRESQAQIETDSETAYFDIAYAYYKTNNYDLAIEYLEQCYEINPHWKYAYDLGISYGYLRNYRTAVKYLNEALELSPPAADRGGILETITMLENYYSIWISSLLQ